MVLPVTVASLAAGFRCQVCHTRVLATTAATHATCPHCKQTYQAKPPPAPLKA